MRLYVGNLPYSTTENELKDLFADYGVHQVKIIMDRESGRARGYAFVEVDRGKDAIDGCHESQFGGRTIVVNEARPRQPQQREGKRRDW